MAFSCVLVVFPRFHSSIHLPAAARPGRFKQVGDTWVVRFERALPPEVDETGFTIVTIDSETGRIVEM